jgi:hypothetical protein
MQVDQSTELNQVVRNTMSLLIASITISIITFPSVESEVPKHCTAK